MSNRIDLKALDEIAKNAQEMCHHERLLRVNVFTTESVVRELIAELKRCYEKIDWLQQVADLAADNVGRKNWDGFEEAMYEAGLWERPSE